MSRRLTRTVGSWAVAQEAPCDEGYTRRCAAIPIPPCSAAAQQARVLAGWPIRPSGVLTADVSEAVAAADLVVVAVPPVYLRATVQRIAPALRRDCPMVSLAKGLEIDTFCRPTDILRQTVGAE